MTLAELLISMPNGLHDSELRELTFDLINQEVRLVLDIWIGNLGSNEHNEREKYQRAEVRLINLGFWISQPTDPSEFPLSKESLCIDVRKLPEDYKPGIPLPESNPENPTYYLYSTDINTCFFFACESAALQWL